MEEFNILCRNRKETVDTLQWLEDNTNLKWYCENDYGEVCYNPAQYIPQDACAYDYISIVLNICKDEDNTNPDEFCILFDEPSDHDLMKVHPLGCEIKERLLNFLTEEYRPSDSPFEFL